MKHLSWNYSGYDNLSLNFKCEELQGSWNILLLNVISKAYRNTFGSPSYNIFVSKRYLPIFENMPYYDASDKTVGGRKIIALDIDTPKIYITDKTIDLYMGIEPDNHASVVIINCNLPEYVKTY